jgi:hypothetical protein
MIITTILKISPTIKPEYNDPQTIEIPNKTLEKKPV